MDIKDQLILIVDDNVQNLKVLGNTIKDEGWPLAVADSGQKALDFLKRRKPSLILLDIMMPELDGFETCRRIKADDDTKDIPVIFLTAKHDTESIIKGFDEGAVDYINKPFNAKELIRRIQTHLELIYSRQLLIEKNEIHKEFLHILCHDLSNPLAAIHSFAGLLQQDPADWEKLTKYIVLSVENSLDIIESTRELRASEEKEIEISRLNLKKSVSQSEFILQAKLDEKNIQLEIKVSEHIEILAETVSLTNSVISNLLTNAIKFSEPGSVIKIDAEKEGENTVKVYFRDSGIGMSQRLINDLFNLSKSTTRRGTNGERGTGFGMPLVKKSMERYGGDIQISSQPIDDFPDDHGTEICLVFRV